MEPKSSFSFLLGGHDLEMAEIRRILEPKGISFYGNNLGWNNANIDQLEDGLLTEEQKEELFRSLLLYFGIGAKTNVGYRQFDE
jgi:CRISPR/Cas system CMR subunit Cmr6 (Cas7 group RAMP superfamily)